MSDKTFKILGVVAGLLVLLSIVISFESPTVTFEFKAGQLLVNDVDLSRISSIEISGENDSAKLVRRGGAFVVESKSSYPASNKDINQLIGDATKIRLNAEVTTNKSNHADLGVADGAATRTLAFVDKEGKDIVRILVGNQASGGMGYFVRLGNSDTVYRSEEYISFRDRGLDYIDKTLLKIEKDDIAMCEVVAEGTRYTVASPEKGKVELKAVPKGKKVKGTDYERVFDAAANLTFTDFDSQANKKDLTFDAWQEITLRSKVSYKFEVAKSGDKFFARCSAKYLGGRVTIDPNKKYSDEELKAKEAILLAKGASEKFNQQHQSWVYELSSWQAENLVKKLDDLLEDDDGKPAEIAASHILIGYEGAERSEVKGRSKAEAKTMAEAILTEVQADPSKFAEIAKAKSDGPSKTKGGDLGTFDQKAMAPEFTAAAFVLEVGALSGVVETPFGFHIIQRTK